MTNNKRVIRIKDVMRRESESYMEGFNGYHMLSYILVQNFYSIGMDANVITPNVLFSVAGVTNTKTKDKIKESLLDLIKWGLISSNEGGEIQSLGNNNTLILSIPHMNEDRFTSLNAEFCMRIITSENRIDTKINALMVYSLLAQYTGEKDYCFPGVERMAEELLVDRKTINNALNVLVELDIIQYDNNGARQSINGTYVQSNNIYVMNDIPNAREVLLERLREMRG